VLDAEQRQGDIKKFEMPSTIDLDTSNHVDASIAQHLNDLDALRTDDLEMILPGPFVVLQGVVGDGM